jgi:hypothetical protein
MMSYPLLLPAQTRPQAGHGHTQGLGIHRAKRCMQRLTEKRVGLRGGKVSGDKQKCIMRAVMILIFVTYNIFFRHNSPSWPRPPLCWGLEITLGHTLIGRTPPHEGSAHPRDLYLTTQNIHNRHPSLRRDSYPQSQQASGRRPRGPLDRRD